MVKDRIVVNSIELLDFSSSLIATGSTCITLYYRLVHLIIVLSADLIELSPTLNLDELARGH